MSLTRLIPRPSRVDNWTYVFFIDFAGHHSDALIADVLEQIRSEALEVRLLGSYPKGVL